MVVVLESIRVLLLQTVSEKLIKYQNWNLLNTITEWLSLTLCYEDMKIEIKEKLGQTLFCLHF